MDFGQGNPLIDLGPTYDHSSAKSSCDTGTAFAVYWNWALVLKVRQSEKTGIPYHTDSRSIKASVCITITIARRAFSQAGTIKSFLASLQWKRKYFLCICSWRIGFGERRGKQDYNHQISPEHTVQPHHSRPHTHCWTWVCCFTLCPGACFSALEC